MKKNIKNTKNIKIKNYTSSMPVERIIANIEKELVKIGISHIEKFYDNGILTGIIFSITIPQKISFKIPTNIESVFEVLKKIPEYKHKKEIWLQEQATRTAWKIIFNWIEVQVSMIMLKQADAMQVFLPYMYNGHQTYYQHLSATNFKLLASFE